MNIMNKLIRGRGKMSQYQETMANVLRRELGTCKDFEARAGVVGLLLGDLMRDMGAKTFNANITHDSTGVPIFVAAIAGAHSEKLRAAMDELLELMLKDGLAVVRLEKD
jgi:hypothetical protein